jgi:hypothetical protein
MSLTSVFAALGTVADFLNWQHRLAGVEGFPADLEGYALLRVAASGGGVGAGVEIGSYLGRSTAFLLAGSKSAGREKVVAVDHFRGSPEHYAGQKFASATLARETNIVVLGTALHRECIVCRLDATPGWRTRSCRSIEKWPERMDLWKDWQDLLHDWDDPDREATARAFYEARREEMDA